MTLFNALRILQVLKDHDVRYVLIGGIAGSALGSPSVTDDLDICYERTESNMRSLAHALESLQARLRGVDDDVPFLLDETTLKNGDSFNFDTNSGPLDCLGTPAGTDGYSDLIANAEIVDFEGIEVRVAALEDLIRMKRAAGRPKDRIELEILGALRDRLEGRDSDGTSA